MYVVARGKTCGGFNVIRRKGGGIHRLMNLKTEGHGVTKEFYEKTDVSHPFKSLEKKRVTGLGTVKVKTERPKKYISLNL